MLSFRLNYNFMNLKTCAYLILKLSSYKFSQYILKFRVSLEIKYILYLINQLI